MESWEGVGSWRLGWGMGGGKSDVYKKEGGSRGNEVKEVKEFRFRR